MIILIRTLNQEIIEGECKLCVPPEQMIFARKDGTEFNIHLVGKADGLPYYYQEGMLGTETADR